MKKGRRFWLTTICILLAAALLLPGCTAQLPENLLPFRAPSWQAWEWQPVYNEGSPLNIHAVYTDPGTYWEQLSPEKIAALTPSVKMDWMQISGDGRYYNDGTPFYLQLEIKTRGEPVYLLIGEHDPCVMYEQETAEVTKCVDVEYRLYREDQYGQKIRLEATAIMNDVPMHFVMHEAVEADIEDFETVLQCFATYPEGKPSLNDGIAVSPDTIERSDWSPVYPPRRPENEGVCINIAYRDTHYEELRPEQLAMLHPQQSPYWMKTSGYTHYYTYASFRLKNIHMRMESLLPGVETTLSAVEIPKELLDGVIERESEKVPDKKNSISICHDVKLDTCMHISENTNTLVTTGRINNFSCTFNMSVPKSDDAFLEQAKAEFEMIVESYCQAGEKGELFWDEIKERHSDEYDTKDITLEDAYADRVFGPYVSVIGSDGTISIDKISRTAFFLTDELRITFTSAEDTFEWCFQRSYGYQTQPIKPGQETENRTPVYAPEDVTEELLRSHMETNPKDRIGVLFEDMLLLIGGPERHVPWMYQQITRMQEQTRQQ